MENAENSQSNADVPMGSRPLLRMNAVRSPVAMLQLLLLALTPAAVHACDAGVLWGANCSSEKASNGDPACNAWPLGANATSTSTVLIWKKGGAGYGGVGNKGGDVFLSTFVSYGCSSGYYGAQMHWNTMKMSLDWAMWDSGGGHNPDGSPMPMTHPINPTDSQGRPTDRKGHLCSTHEPPPKGFVQCPCSRYSGEGFGTQCGLTAADDYLWEIGTPYTLNISLRSKNSSGATFGSTITNMKTKEMIEVGQIYTTSPDMTKQDCSTMPVGGGSFQEYYDGGNFTNWAEISGPRFKGVAGSVDKAGNPVDVVPTAFGLCAFFGNCSKGGYGGCHNETTVPCLPADGCHDGYEGLPALTFTSGFGTPIASQFVPPWYNWAETANADDTAGPDGGIVLPAGPDDCDIYTGNYTAGGFTPPHWGVVSGANNMRVANVGQPDAGCALEEKEGKIGPCALLCCAYCKADKDCVMAELANGGNCALKHVSSKAPFGPPQMAKAVTMVMPRGRVVPPSPPGPPAPPAPAPPPPAPGPAPPSTDCTFLPDIQLYDPGSKHTVAPVPATSEQECCGICKAYQGKAKCYGAELYGGACYVKTAQLPHVKQLPPKGVKLVACVLRNNTGTD